MDMQHELTMAFTQKYPKSICACGHTGDGANSDHIDTFSLGHGMCIVKGCPCKQFTWDRWTLQAEKVLNLK